jgi:hypothetical protein
MQGLVTSTVKVSSMYITVSNPSFGSRQCNTVDVNVKWNIFCITVKMSAAWLHFRQVILSLMKSTVDAKTENACFWCDDLMYGNRIIGDVAIWSTVLVTFATVSGNFWKTKSVKRIQGIKTELELCVYSGLCVCVFERVFSYHGIVNLRKDTGPDTFDKEQKWEYVCVALQTNGNILCQVDRLVGNDCEINRYISYNSRC